MLRLSSMLRRSFPIAVALLAVLAVVSPAIACPSCKQALASQEGGGDLVQGFFWSILFMLSMPFTILGVFSGCMYLAVRRARASQPLPAGKTAQAGPNSLPKPIAGASAPAPEPVEV
jgi:hypothetical protein